MKKYRIVKRSNGHDEIYIVEKKGLFGWSKLKWDDFDFSWKDKFCERSTPKPTPLKDTVKKFGQGCYFGYNNDIPGDDLEYFYSLDAAKFFIEGVKVYNDYMKNIKHTKEIIKL